MLTYNPVKRHTPIIYSKLVRARSIILRYRREIVRVCLSIVKEGSRSAMHAESPYRYEKGPIIPRRGIESTIMAA